MKFKCFYIFLVVFLFSSISVFSQDLLKGKDISQIKIDMLTDDEILNYKQQLQQSGLTESQAEQLALQRGFPASEIVKLRARLAKLDVTDVSKFKQKEKLNPTKPQKNFVEGREVDSSGFEKDLKKIKEKRPSSYIFGGDLFTNENITFEPNLRIPTPKNYVIGPDDEVVVDVYGYQEVNQKLQVSPEGFITIPYVGMIQVNGLTVEQAAKRIKDKMAASGYASLSNGQSKVNVSIGKIRSIKVTVIGEATKVGTYTLSSLSTLFHALYAAGGPNEKGSLRAIEVIRNSKVIEKFDAYSFLMKGNQNSDIRLMDRDVIRIPTAVAQVTLSGEVKKPAVYEVLGNETLSDAINYAGGFEAGAYTASLHIVQNTDKEKVIVDVPKPEFNIYKPKAGDIIAVEKVLDRFANKISITGAVYRPGQYALSDGLTLSKLIANADGLKDEAFKERGVLVRTNEDYSKQIIAFDPINIVQGKQADIPLKKNDEINIGVAEDFKEQFRVTIEGQVKNPGDYLYYENLSLKDVIFAAGGFTEGSSVDRIEVARRINTDKYDSSNTTLALVTVISSEKELSLKGNDIKLRPWDIVSIRTKVGYKPQIKVYVEGEVLYPGGYILSSKNDKVSNLINRAGGLTTSAFKKGAYITRVNKSNVLKDTSDIYFKKILQQTKDTSGNIAAEYASQKIKIGIELEKILIDTNSTENVFLQENDVITIPKQKREIKVSGEVLFPTEVVYVQGEDLRYYLDRAGGFTDNAQKNKVYVLRPNGVAAKTKKFLFFRKFPEVEEGSEILVPKISETKSKKLSTVEVVGLASAVASLAGVVVAVLNITK